jgi:hypothetical protein
MGRIRTDKWYSIVVPVHHLQGGTRGTRTSAAPRGRHPKLHGPFDCFQLEPMPGLARAVRTPHGVRTPQLGLPLLNTEQQLRAQASLAYLLFCVGVRVGSLRYIPLEPICIHSLSTCTFPVLVIIYLKHYLYSCSEFDTVDIVQTPHVRVWSCKLLSRGNTCMGCNIKEI